MCAQNTPDHWAKLISEMGVQASPKEPAKVEPTSEVVKEEEEVVEVLRDETQASEPIPAPQDTPPSPPVKVAECVRPTSDWDRLAEELGVPVAPRPSQPVPPVVKKVEQVSPPAKREAIKAPPATEFEFKGFGKPDEPAESEAEAEPPVASSKEWEDEMGELTDPLFLDSAALREEASAESESSTENADESSEPKAKSGRRRRRRRRGRRLPETEPTETEIQEVEAEAAADSVELIDAEAASSSSSSAEGETAPAAEGTESGERRRHRRRRRSRRKPGASSSEPASEREIDDEEAPSSADRAEGDVAEGDVADEEWSVEEGDHGDADEADEDEQSLRLSHRAIPTWEEAIQLVIANNLESRSKHPTSGSAPRGRGGHRKPRERPSGK